MIEKNQLKQVCRKARAKKPYRQAIEATEYSPERKQEIEEKTRELNEQLITKMTSLVEEDAQIDLREIQRIYKQEMEKITGAVDMCFTAHNEVKQTYPSFYKNKYAEKELTESYIILASVMDINPLLSTKNSLEMLLEMDFGVSDDEESSVVEYVDVKNVVKSKGNPIHGPRREDVGKFNRKIFESYTRDLERSKHSRVMVNLVFFPKYLKFFAHDQIISSDFVKVHLFSSPDRTMFDDALIALHVREERTLCTILYSSKPVAERLEKRCFRAAMNRCKRKINILSLESFLLFSVEFICESAASFLYKTYFKPNNATSAQ